MPGRIGKQFTDLDDLREAILDMWEDGDSVQDIVEFFSDIKVESGKRKGKNKVTPEYVAHVVDNFGEGIDYPLTKTYIKRKSTEWRMVCHNILLLLDGKGNNA